MLFTDVVGSTELLARIGDAECRALRATHERHVRLEVEQSGGRLINVTGDGTFSLFDTLQRVCPGNSRPVTRRSTSDSADREVT